MRRFTPTEDQKLIYLYESGFTVAYICKELQREKSSVTWRMKKLGLSRRPKRGARAKCIKVYMHPKLFERIHINARVRGNNVSQYLESLLTRILM